MTVIRNHIVLGAVLFLLICQSTTAQDHSDQSFTFEFRGETLVEVLDHIARETEIDLIYDPELVRGIYVYQRLQKHTVTELLSRLLKEYHLDYITLSSGTMVIVRSPRENPAFGTIAGKIVDVETGEPLPGASIMLADASGGTMSNRTGFFSLNRVMSGTHHIIISYLGYESSFRTIDVRPNEQVQERFDLAPKRFDVTPLVVEAHRPIYPTNMNSLVLNSDTEINSSGMINSPIRNLNLVPGIQYGLPMQDLHLQGSHQGEHRMLLDGIPIYNPYSFGQLFSSFSPFAIGNVKLHKAGYGVQEGSQMAGLVELSNDLSFSDRNSVLFQADPLSLNFRGDVSIPFINNNSLEVMTAVRSSYWNMYQNPTLDQMLREWNIIDPLLANRLLDEEWSPAQYQPHYHGSDVNFFDFHTAVGYQPDDYSNISSSVYIAENAIKTLLLNLNPEENTSRRYLYSVDNHEWSNLAWQLQWNRMINPRLDLHVQTAYSQNRFNHRNALGFSTLEPFTTEEFFRGVSASSDAGFGSGFILPTHIDGNLIQHYISRADASYSLSPVFSTDAGVRAERVFSRVDLSDDAYLGTNTAQSSTIISGYLHNNHNFTRNWRITYGSRTTYLNTTNNIYIEPRFSIQYDRPDSKIGYWSVRVAGGLYRQFINEFRITNTGATSIVPDFTIWSHADDSAIPKAYHATASFLVEPSDQTTFTLEGFYKWQPVSNITSYRNLLVDENIDRTEIRAFAGTTKMTILGAGVRADHQFGDSNFRMIAGYDYSYNQMDLSDQFGRKMMSPWNEPHRAQLRSIYRLMPNFSILAKWQGIWGRTWAFRQSYYNYLRTEGAENLESFLFDRPDNDKLSSFQQVDLSFIYQPQFAGIADMEFRIELINLLNRRNTIEKYLMPIFNGDELPEYEIRERNLPGFYPSVSFQLKF